MDNDVFKRITTGGDNPMPGVPMDSGWPFSSPKIVSTPTPLPRTG
jgi:hypothetical protein